MAKPTNQGGNRPLPPAETRWKKGQSGNPKGRPKGRPFAERLRDEWERRYPSDPTITNEDAFIRAFVQKAIAMEPWAAKEHIDRTMGRTPERVEHSGSVILTDEDMSWVRARMRENLKATEDEVRH